MDEAQAAHVFNAGNVSLASIATQIRNLQVRALTPAQFEDVFLLIEFAQRETVKLHDEVNQRVKAVVEREKAVTDREIKAAAHQRALNVAGTAKGNRLRLFGRG